MYVLQELYNAVYSCLDFYSNEWTSWRFAWDLVVTAGPSCCPFSVSGKRLRQEDPRSSQGLSTAMLAVHLDALVLIMENVTNLVDEESMHHLVSQMDAYLLGNGMIAVGTWRLFDASLGGGTGRTRVFLRWEQQHMASCLPPLRLEPLPAAHTPLRAFLDDPLEVAHLQVAEQSIFVPEPLLTVNSSPASVVGKMWLRGAKDAWMPGEALKLFRDDRVWRVLEVAEDRLKLIFDCRRNPKFRWIRKSSLRFSQRHWISWPVHGIDGIAKAIRHTNFAPGDLYLNDRLGVIVRPLSGSEKWRLTGLSDGKKGVLQAGGLGAELGQLAGSSIPCNMTRVVAEDESERIARYKTLLLRRKAGSFTLMPPVAGLHTKDLCATFLLFLGISQSDVLVWNSCELPGMVHDVSQQQAFEQACCWSRQLGCDTVDHCVILECDMGQSRARTIMNYAPSAPKLPGAEVIKISEVMLLPIGELAVRALAQVERMAKSITAKHSEVSGWQSGRVSGSVVFQEMDAPFSSEQ